MPSGKRHRRLTLGDALLAHQTALQYGGLPGIPNLDLVESALARPYNGYYRPISAKAAALVESFAKNHGFADANKRTTLILLDLLVTESGYQINASGDDLEALILDVVANRVGFDQLREWLKARIDKA